MTKYIYFEVENSTPLKVQVGADAPQTLSVGKRRVVAIPLAVREGDSMVHFGTESVPAFYGSVTPLRGSLHIEKMPPTHAFESLDGEDCKRCGDPESEHRFEYKIAQYLTNLVAAHRTVSKWDQERAEYWWGLLTEREKSLAAQILVLTTTKVW